MSFRDPRARRHNAGFCEVCGATAGSIHHGWVVCDRHLGRTLPPVRAFDFRTGSLLRATDDGYDEECDEGVEPDRVDPADHEARHRTEHRHRWPARVRFRPWTLRSLLDRDAEEEENLPFVDPRRTAVLTDFLTDRLTMVHGGDVDIHPEDSELPAELTIVLLGDTPFYVVPDLGEPTTARAPRPDAVLLSACPVTELVDLGAAEHAIQLFLDDLDTPDDVRVWTTVDHVAQVWLDRPTRADISYEVAAASLDEFVDLATRLRAALAPLDLSTSPDALARAQSSDFGEPVSWDLIAESEWPSHPWLSRLVQRSNIDGDRYFCLFGPRGDTVELFRRIELQFERRNGVWETVSPEIPGPHMPAQDWEAPGVAWYDHVQWLGIDDGPDGPTGRWRARVPTGWCGPPV